MYSAREGEVIMKSIPMVRMEKICKTFGAVKALQDVDLELWHNEVLGLVGDNASGKSTLVKCLSGAYIADSGMISIEGKEVKITNPILGRSLGIEMVYQDLALCPNLTVAENVFLGRELLRPFPLLKLLDKQRMNKRAKEILYEMRIDISDVTLPVRYLSGGQRQSVALARSAHKNPKVLILDEPTAALSVRVIAKINELITQFKAEGVSIIYISHRLPDVLKVSDRIQVLRSGRVTAVKKASETTIDEIIRFMLGVK